MMLYIGHRVELSGNRYLFQEQRVVPQSTAQVSYGFPKEDNATLDPNEYELQ